LERQTPRWVPGSKHGYHVRTYGWLAQEIVRRADGRTVGAVLRDEVAGPLGLDLWIGLPEEADEPGGVASIIGPPPLDGAARASLDRIMGPGTPLGDALNGPSNLFAYDGRWNQRPFRAAEMPSSNGVATARALARLYAATIGEVDGIRLLRGDTLADAVAVRSEGPDATIMLPTRFGTGFALPPMLGTACPDTAFGHPGAGGSLGFADPAHGVAFGYVMNQMQMGMTGDARTTSLVSALYDSLGSASGARR
jgi:CubicO group peptidase (beta-lactamase class C family)